MRIGVTGARGLLGSALLRQATARGHVAIPIALPRTESIKDANAIEQLLAEHPFQTLIHTAAVLRPRSALDDFVNAQLPGILQRVFGQTQTGGRFLHISSLNVAVQALSDAYTRGKREAERSLLPGCVLVRPSLIWSHEDRGAAAKLRRFVRRFPVVPMCYPGSRHRPVLDQHLAREIITLAEVADGGPEVVLIRGDTALTTWQMAQQVAREVGHLLIPIPLPLGCVRLPKWLRSVDYTLLDEYWQPQIQREIVLPFSLERCDRE